MKEIVQNICRLFEQNEDFVLSTIISHTGSTPRTAGTKMIVRSDGNITGTIGGGSVEAEVIKIARAVFETKGALIRSFDLKVSKAIDSMDMLCGGHLTILFEWIQPDDGNIGLYRELLQALKTGEDALLLGILPESGRSETPLKRCLITGEGTVPEDFPITDETLRAVKKAARGQRAPVTTETHGKRFLVDPVFPTGTIYIFGAGHVSLQLARLTHMVDFRTVILDDRAEFASRERFGSADDLRVLKNFETAFDEIAADADSYVVILTRGHSHDKTVLAQALRTDAGYIGMIGSRRKRDALYEELLKEGFTRKDLKRVCSPIGLHIRAETPEEIAVSIVAELIEARADR